MLIVYSWNSFAFTENKKTLFGLGTTYDTLLNITSDKHAVGNK